MEHNVYNGLNYINDPGCSVWLPSKLAPLSGTQRFLSDGTRVCKNHGFWNVNCSALPGGERQSINMKLYGYP